MFFFKKNSRPLHTKIGSELSAVVLCLYTTAWALLFYGHMTVLTGTLYLYHLLFSVIKERLELEAAEAQLSIATYDFLDSTYYKMITSICMVGLLLCYLNYKKNSTTSYIMLVLKRGLRRNIKLFIMVNTCYGCAVAITIFFYIERLQTLVQSVESAPIGINPFRLLFAIIQKINILGHILGKLDLLQKVTALYATISHTSLLFYLAALGCGLCSTVWFFYGLSKDGRTLY